MADIDKLAIAAFKYLTGDLENICRLCCCDTENILFLHETRILETNYCDETVTFEYMLKNLGTLPDPSLPQIICEQCADLLEKAYLFLRLTQYSHNKWLETIDKLSKSIDYSDTLGPIVKTAYYIVQKEKDLILTSRKTHKEKTPKIVLGKIQDLLKSGKKRSSKNNRKHPCPFCQKIFPNLTNLLLHKERMHRPKTVQCPKCSKMFSTEKMLKYHDSLHHISASCKHCCMEFSSKKELRKHLNKHDVSQCPHCGKEFKNKQVFASHMKICGNNEIKQLSVFCDICNKGYNRKNSLRTHLKIEHGFGQTFSCNWCSKKFDAVSRLKMHIVKHTRERNFTCELCGGLFVTKAALTYHTRIHTGEKPFPCDLCEESFLSASRRMEHKRRKHFVPQHQCNVCNSKFTSKYDLKKHSARHKNPQSRLFISENDGQKNSVNSAPVRKIVYF